MKLFLSILLSLLAVAAYASPVPPAASDSSAPQVRLVTFYPGEEPFSVFGHTEVRVIDPPHDLYFNYGVFDFNSDGFVWRFALGKAEYLCIGLPEKYSRAGMEGRRMVEQRLNLSPEQARSVRDYLIMNSLEGNNTYLYQYLSDNCSTRPRDIIEAAVGDSIRYRAFTDTVTYRSIISHYAANYAWTRFGINLVLGSGLDRPISTRERMFIPMDLMRAFGEATLTRDGRELPLVTDTEVMVDTSTDGTVLPLTPWWCSPMAMAVALLLVTALVSVRDVRRRRVSAWFDTMVFGVYGLTGVLLFFLMFMSVREATWPNYNALWVNPFMLFAAVAVWLPRWWRVLRVYHAVNAVVIALTLVLWPLLPQVADASFFPLMSVPLIRSAVSVWLRRK